MKRNLRRGSDTNRQIAVTSNTHLCKLWAFASDIWTFAYETNTKYKVRMNFAILYDFFPWFSVAITRLQIVVLLHTYVWILHYFRYSFFMHIFSTFWLQHTLNITKKKTVDVSICYFTITKSSGNPFRECVGKSKSDYGYGHCCVWLIKSIKLNFIA